MNILDEIIENKRLEVASVKAAMPQEQLPKNPVPPLPFLSLFTEKKSIIAEVKPKSPSKGVLIPTSPIENVRIYEQSEYVGAVSVLTDKKYFSGSLELFDKARNILNKPMLRKDFIIDEYQIHEARSHGADAVLLIARCLEQVKLVKFLELTHSLGMEALVEVHDEADLEKSLASGAKLIGINNRDLDTLAISLEVTERLAKLMPTGIPFISESGIDTAEDVRRVTAAGARGLLVGTSILRSPDPLVQLRTLYEALQ